MKKTLFVLALSLLVMNPVMAKGPGGGGHGHEGGHSEAIHHGGSLHHDIATDLPGARAHRLPEPEGRHALPIEAGTRLPEILDGQAGAVNSRHHQAVARDGPGLRVCARAEDGVIEAVERVDGPFCIGVQWHPERMEDGHRERLFGAFVRACRGA